MARSSLVHYIIPSAISITPNCNSSVSDLAVYLARGTKIKVNSKNAGIDTAGGSYQEWVLTGRNRRLADSTVPYTIYARLRKTDKTDGYLMFVPQQQVSGEWKDKYPYVTTDGLYRDVYGQESRDYYYVRLGDVTLPGADGREVILDTGILGTEQYNEEWNLNPDNLPMRVELNCTIGDEDAGPTPYVFWGETLQLVASLTKGWNDIESPSLDHWEITRDSGDATADAAWPGSARAEQFASTGVINLLHSRTNDDFNGAVNATFTVNAWGYPDTDSSGTPQLQILQSASICIMAETIESFDLVKSSDVVTYNPQTDEYTPSGGVDINVRATSQRGEVSDVTVGQFNSIGLALSYARVGSDQWTQITVSGQPSDLATGNIPVSAFSPKESINVRLTRSDGGAEPEITELVRSTIAMISDGEDSKNREWIYRLDVTTDYDSKTGTVGGDSTKPVSGKTGEDWNADLTDDFVPTGWSDNAVVISEDHPTAYVTWRDYDNATGKWGDFVVPSVWSQWGSKGTDGDGVQYLYKLFDHELTDAERTSNIPASPTFNPSTKKWEATGWSDNPPAGTASVPFCYCSVIQYINGSWGTFQKLGLWSKYGKDGDPGDNGENGTDAQDCEWVYIRTKTATAAPVISSDTTYTDHNGRTYTSDGHLPRVVAQAGNTDIESNNSGDPNYPFECSATPKGTNDTWRYEWQIKRTKGAADATTHHRTWNAYSGTMILLTDPAFNRYIDTILGGATGNSHTVAVAQNAVLDALRSTIYSDGGLLLGSMIAVRKLQNGGDPEDIHDYDTWGGISGEYDDWSQGTHAKGHGIAAWYGGDMIDYEMLSDTEKAAGWGTGTNQHRYAKSLFRFDGTGYLAGGKISWDENGDGFVANGNVAWTTDNQGVTSVTINGVTVQSSPSVNTQQLLLNGTDITTALTNLIDMFEKDTTTEPGTTLIKAKYSLYSVGDISAMGQSSGGGGGGGGASVLYELNDVTPNAAGNEVMGIVITDGQTTEGDGYVLTFDGSTKKWKAAPTTETYVLPQATSGALGGIKIGFTASEKNYAVQLDNAGKAYVNVPWTDTTYTLAGLMGSTAKGGTTQPIYWNGSEFKNTAYTLAKSVPADAVFTDHYDWNDITNKPSTFAPSSGSSYYLTRDAWWTNGETHDANDLRSGVVFAYSTQTNVPVTGTMVAFSCRTNGNYALQLQGAYNLDTLYFRNRNGDNNTWKNWHYVIHDGNIGNQSVNYATSAGKATNDSDGNAINSTYLKLSGGTLTGVLTLKGSQYDGYKTGSARTYGLNANNSDIVGVNSIIMSDKSDSWAESFGFPRDDSGNAGHYDTFRAANGTFYFGFNGYFDSSNVEHAASELVTITGTTIKLQRADSSTASVRMKNTSRDISLDAGSTNCGVYYQTGSKWLIGTNGTDTWLSTGKVGIGTTSPVSQLDVRGDSGVWSGYFQGGSNSGVYLAYADGNGMFVNSKSTSASTYLFFCGYGATQLGTAANTAFRVNCDGKVGVGVNPSYKFHVSGDIYATGDITAASDQRAKCDIEQIDLSVEQIANAPAVKFSWKDKRDNLRHVGTFAQYWQKALPESVTEKNYILGMNYGAAALVSVVKVAKEVLTHEEEIELLRKRISELEQEVEQLKSA